MMSSSKGSPPFLAQQAADVLEAQWHTGYLTLEAAEAWAVVESPHGHRRKRDRNFDGFPAYTMILLPTGSICLFY